MKNKVFSSFQKAVADIHDGATIMLHSFIGPTGVAQNLILSLRDHGAKNLTVISCNFGASAGIRKKPGFQTYVTPGILIESGQVKKAITGWAKGVEGDVCPLEAAMRKGEIEVELVPQGLLPERIRAGGAGLGGFYSPVGVDTVLSVGKEERIIDGKKYVFETPLRADYGFVRAHKADRYGNLVYRLISRSYNPIIATAADICIAEVDEIVEPGELDPEHIVTPGCFIDRIVKIPREE